MLLVLLLVEYREEVLSAAARCCDHSTVGNGISVHHECIGICAQSVNRCFLSTSILPFSYHLPQANTTPAWGLFLPCKVGGSSVYWKHTTFPRATGGKRYVEAGDQVG